MTSGRYGLVLREVGRLLGGGSVATLGAGQLLERFAAERDSSAFEALVSRHGPMVLGTCRRMLSDPHDVEDAFQATFLVLARKAGSIEDADRLGPWLHGVARRIASRSRALAGRRKSFEKQGFDKPAVEAPDLLEGFEVREALDEELSRLPEKYRAPLVLCYLEGLTHDEAAEQLRWPVGTVRSRLSGGRDRLRAALTRRGFAPSAAVPAFLHSVSIPQGLLTTTVRVATTAGSPSVHVATLAKGALIAMTWNKLKMVAVVGMMAGLTVGGAGVAAQKGEQGHAKAPVVGELNDDQIKKVEERRFTATLNAIQEQRKRLQTSLEKIVRKIEQIRYDQAKTLPELEKEAEELRDRIDSVDRKWKELAAKGEIEAKVEGSGKQPDAVNDRIKILEGELLGAEKEIKRLTAELQVSKTVEAKLQKLLAARDDDVILPPPATVEPKKTAKLQKLMAARDDDIILPPPGTAEPKKTANPSPRPPDPMVMSLGDDLVLLIPSERDRVTVLDTKTNKRTTQKLPPGLTEVMPVISPSGVVALHLKGPEVRQVAVLDVQGGKWYSQDLKEPAKFASPAVGIVRVNYQIGRFLYVFSIQAKKWGILELKRDPGHLSNVFAGSTGQQDGKMMIPEGDLIHVYDPETGEWTHIDTKDDK